MPTESLPPYRYGGARALVELHELHIRSFLETWKAAHGAGVRLPKTDDPSYASLETVLWHVCAAAKSYMVWMCEQLELPDPEIRSAPKADTIVAEVDEYVDHLLAGWRKPLAGVEGERFDRPEYPSRWKTRYCIDAMLEHAVMHPIRHEHQLERLMADAG